MCIYTHLYMCVGVKFRRNGEKTRRKHTIHVTEWQVRRAAVRQMSKMLRLELVGIVLLACTQILTEHRDFYGPFNQYGHQRSGHRRQWEDDGMTKEVRVKEGLLRGMVKRPATNQRLQLVDVFLGVPYAEPPVGFLRFSPPRSPQPWRHVRKAEEFAPVCPQLLPNLRLEVEPGRHEFLERLLPYLRNQSEDCLYLNIYAPHQVDGPGNPRRYPVMVFIQGESFEWNSGNPYDGTVISAYGNVVFVTINFRLGILGFLRPGTSSDVASNFGLLDQTAALVWLRDNIAFFGGDPDSMTLVGHGTGAIFANLLLISPVANNKGLFRRAILMSGSALSSDAIGKAPLQITKQVAHALNCPTKSDNDLALCLRNRDLDVLLNVKIAKPRYVPAYAPLIDRAVLPRKPLALMQNAQLFGSFDLMYGVTESEKYHLLSPIDALHGMLDQERDNVLRDYAKATHELEPELALTKILDHYGDFREGYTGEYTIKNRDLVLDALSDGGTVAPLMMVADMHSRANPKSYMYVFTHLKATQDYTQQQRQRTVHGEEIPYILGIPLDAGKYHFMSDRYSIGEKLFSEAMMTWWCNFAHTGNPNAPRRLAYMTDGPREWMQYQVDWPEYSSSNRTYFNLTIPPNVDLNYRANAMQFWNNDLPNVIRHRPTAPRPIILDYADGMGNFSMESMPGLLPASTTIVHDSDNLVPSPTGKILVNDVRSSTSITENASMRGLSAITMVVGFGVVFFLINVTAFLYLYHRRHSLKRKEKKSRSGAPNEADNNSTKRTRATKPKNNQLADNVEIGQKSISTPDINEVIKHDKAYDNNSNFGRRSKLSRQNSSSTIDTHIKVKEWIQQEIVHRCSPRFLRKTRETLRKEHQERLTTQQQIEEDEERKRCHEEKRREDSAAPTYEHSPALVVRPGKKTKAPKVSVAVDATPATRTESILNQIPIELVKNMEMINDLAPLESDATPSKPRVVVIEHHHSRSDPLPMEDIFKCANPNFSTTRMYESDSESASTLYAKTNTNLKTWLQRAGQAMAPEDKNADKSHLILESPDDDIYALGIGKLTTFGLKEQTGDVNVTCQEPVADRQVISPEEALKTIKRRNYPKVLPDIEKRRSLPAPNSLYVPKVYGTLSKEHRHGARNAADIGQPPPPPPRIFGTSKSLDLAEEIEDREPITTNLHVGPLLKRQDSGTGNNADPNLIDSLERVATDAQKVLSNHEIEYANTLGSGGIATNLKCPLHGDGFAFDQVITDTNTSQSVDCLDRNLGNPNWYRNKEPSAVGTKAPANSSLPNIIGNPNWYKPVATSRDTEERQFTGALSKNNFYAERSNLLNEMKNPGEPKIIITPRVGNLLGQSRQNLSPAASCLTTHKDVHEEPRIVFTPKTEMADRIYSVDQEKSNDRHQAPSSPIESEPKSIATVANQSQVASPLNAMKEERNEPRIIITPKDSKNPAIGPNTKQPKIIIKPTNLPTKNREQRNIPKITAIPSPVSQTLLNFENDTKGPEQPHEAILRLEKPPLRDKPMVTRIPSFSRRKDGRPDYNEKPIDHYDKNDAAQRVHAITTTFSNSEKNSTPFLLEKELDSPASATNSSNSNTNTIKRKPPKK